MKAIPVVGERFFKKSVIASKPPAEAPIATTVGELGPFGSWVNESFLPAVFLTTNFFLFVEGVNFGFAIIILPRYH